MSVHDACLYKLARGQIGGREGGVWVWPDLDVRHQMALWGCSSRAVLSCIYDMGHHCCQLIHRPASRIECVNSITGFDVASESVKHSQRCSFCLLTRLLTNMYKHASLTVSLWMSQVSGNYISTSSNIH